MTKLLWGDVQEDVRRLADRLPRHITQVYGVPTGGSVVAVMLAERSMLHLYTEPPENTDACIVVDDLEDSGATLKPFAQAGFAVEALYRKKDVPSSLVPSAPQVEGWIHFPWEHEGAPTDAVTRLLQYIGEDVHRDGLIDTPSRVTRALKEMTCGYAMDPQEILRKAFRVGYDELIVEKNIKFCSLCEHHMLPFSGRCTIGYIPKGKVIGASKLARLVECYARRLQLQERMTQQIAQAIEKHAECRGVGVVVSAHHMCMGGRGVEQDESLFETSCLLGVLRSDASARQEFLTFCKP